MTKKTILPLSLIVIASTLFAQVNISGIVLDGISNQPIEFVNIGVLENRSGTVSNEAGFFTLQIGEAAANVQFSSIGYETKIT